MVSDIGQPMKFLQVLHFGSDPRSHLDMDPSAVDHISRPLNCTTGGNKVPLTRESPDDCIGM